MTSLVIFIAVGLLSVLASSRRLLRTGRFPELAELAAGGFPFLMLGACLGPSAAGFLRSAELVSVRPLLALGLGVAGLLLGLNVDLRILRRLPPAAYAAAGVQSFATLLLVGVPAALLVFGTGQLGVAASLEIGGLLGAAAAASSSHLAVLWVRSGRIERLDGLSVSLLAILDNLLGIVAVAIPLGIHGVGAAGLGDVGAVLAAPLMGILFGALIAFLVVGAKNDAELSAVTIGGVALVAGSAAYLKTSALLCAVAAGATLSAVGGARIERMVRALARLERPAYLLLLFLVGAHVDLLDGWAWASVPVFVGLRLFGKVHGGRLAAKVGAAALSLPPEPGLALVAQGGISLCIAIEYLVLVSGPGAQVTLDLLAFSAVANEALARRLFALSTRPNALGSAPAAAEGGGG